MPFSSGLGVSTTFSSTAFGVDSSAFGSSTGAGADSTGAGSATTAGAATAAFVSSVAGVVASVASTAFSSCCGWKNAKKNLLNEFHQIIILFKKCMDKFKRGKRLNTKFRWRRLI